LVGSFKKEMEKKSFVTAALTAGFGAMEMNSNLSEAKGMTKLNPLRNNKSYKLSSPNQYQFEGGKHTNFKSINKPVLS